MNYQELLQDNASKANKYCEEWELRQFRRNVIIFEKKLRKALLQKNQFMVSYYKREIRFWKTLKPLFPPQKHK